MTAAEPTPSTAEPNSFWTKLFRPTGLLTLFVSAVVIRAAYLWELRDFALFKYPIVDAETYDLWAEAILRGEQFDSGVFYQDPLFPYLLAALYGLICNSTVLAASIQVLLDAATCVLLALLGKRVFSPAVGGLAGVGAAIYGVFVFNTAILEKTTVSLFAVTAALHLLFRLADRPGRLAGLAAGIVFGLAVLLRGNIYLFAPIAVLWLAWTLRRRHPKWLLITAMFCVGAAISISPVTIRNYVVGGDVVLTTSQSGWNFYKGTSAEANGFLNDPLNTNNVPAHEERQVHRLAEKRTGRKLKPSEMSKYWWSQGIAYIKDNPGEYLKLNLLKLWYVFNAYEIPDSYDYYYFRDQSVVLQVLRFGYWIVSPLGVLGIILACWRRRPSSSVVLLIVFIATYAASVVLFYVASRYRMPMAPVLMLFAGYAIHTIYRWWQQGAKRPALIAGTVGLVLVVAQSTYTAERHINPDYFAFTEANALLNHGEPARALAIYDRIFERGRGRPTLIESRASALIDVGRVDEGIAELRRAWRLAPTRASLYGRLVKAYRDQEDPRAELFSVLRRIASEPGRGGRKALQRFAEDADLDLKLETLELMAWLAHKTDRPQAANEAWAKYLTLAPGSPKILLQVFQANEKRDPQRALAALREYLIVAGDSISAERRAQLERRQRRLERKR